MQTSTPWPSLAAIGGRAGALAAEHIEHAMRAVLRGPSVTSDPRFIRLITRAPHPFGNFAVLARADDPAAANAAADPLISCGAPAAVLTASAPTEALVAALKAAGFERHEGMPAMAVDIDRLAPTSLPAGYAFAQVDAKDSMTWGDVFALGYELPLPVGEPLAAGIGQPNVKYYAISKAGKIVCTSMVFFHGGLAGVYCVATLPEERKRGLGAHATAEPLRLARALGYRVGVLQASAAGHPIYKKLGFADFAEVALFVRIPA